jgi:peptidoglycan/xylan/chitin deacetylase (PgdA/CDA1 family)
MLRPLVESGQIELGNHTWSHPDLTTLTKSDIAKQLTRNDESLKKTYAPHNPRTREEIVPLQVTRAINSPCRRSPRRR